MGKERQAWNFALRGVKREMLFPIPIPDYLGSPAAKALFEKYGFIVK
jgi:hypothetical protein